MVISLSLRYVWTKRWIHFTSTLHYYMSKSMFLGFYIMSFNYKDKQETKKQNNKNKNKANKQNPIKKTKQHLPNIYLISVILGHSRSSCLMFTCKSKRARYQIQVSEWIIVGIRRWFRYSITAIYNGENKILSYIMSMFLLYNRLTCNT
jgi:hypothetical protein